MDVRCSFLNWYSYSEINILLTVFHPTTFQSTTALKDRPFVIGINRGVHSVCISDNTVGSTKTFQCILQTITAEQIQHQWAEGFVGLFLLTFFTEVINLRPNNRNGCNPIIHIDSMIYTFYCKLVSQQTHKHTLPFKRQNDIGDYWTDKIS